MSTPSFPGFPPEGLQFLADLEYNNNRDWFQAHKSVFETTLLDPLKAFVSIMGQRLQSVSANIIHDTRTNGSGSISRIYRDIRFSEDKSPYKTYMGVFFWEGTGKKMENPGFHLHLDAKAAVARCGIYMFPKPMLTRYRQAVVDEALGADLVTAIDTVKNSGDYQIGGEHYKRVPRGFDADHAHADFLRYNGLGAHSPQIDAATLTSPDLIDICFEHFYRLSPLHHWLVRLYQE